MTFQFGGKKCLTEGCKNFAFKKGYCKDCLKEIKRKSDVSESSEASEDVDWKKDLKEIFK